MVNDNIHDPASLTYKAVCCIFQVLETYGTLPLNYICRIFAHNGLVQRLYAVIKQIISWQRQQQQRGAGGYASSTASAAAGVSINTGGGAGSLLGLKLHHMHSPSAGSVGQQGYGQEGQSAAAGGEAAGSSGRRGGAGRETALAGGAAGTRWNVMLFLVFQIASCPAEMCPSAAEMSPTLQHGFCCLSCCLSLGTYSSIVHHKYATRMVVCT
jgi:hypothetical protein